MAEKLWALDFVWLKKIEALIKALWIPSVSVYIFDKKKAIQGAKNLGK